MYLVSFLILSLLCLCRGDLIVNQFGPVLDEIFYADSYDRVGSTPAYMMIAADDFLVPPTYSMTINSVLFSGHFISGSYSDRNVRNFTVLIYGDTISTTFPGYHVPDTTNLIASQVQIPTTVTYPSMTMNVSFVSPPTLQSGQYWVGIYANMKGPALTFYFNIDRLQTSTTYGERFVSKESDATFYPDAYENKWVPYNESTMFKPGYFGRGGYNLAFNIYGSITDSTPPTVSSFLFSPTSFDFIIGKMMNFSVTVSDNVGVKAVEISLQSPNQVSDVFLKLGSGNSTIGNWIYSTNFAFDPTSGNWSIIKIDVVDYAGNWKNYTETEIRSLFGSYHSFTVSNGLTSTASSSSSTTALTSTSLSTTSTTATTTSSTLTSLSTTTTSVTTLSSSTSSFTSTSTLTTAGGSTSTSSTTGTTGTTATTITTGTTAKATTGTTATTVEGTTTSGITSTTSVSSTTSDMLTTISTSSTTSSPSMNSSDVNNFKSASSSSAIIPIIGAAGGFIVLVAIGLILFFVFRRKRSKNASKQEVPSTQVSIGNYNNFNSSSSSVGSLYMPMSESRSTTISQNPSRLTIIDPLVVISYAELKIENEVGNGAYGIVFRGTWRGGAVAIKQINGRLTPKQLNDFKLEASIMKNLRPHVNVVQFLGVTLHPDPLCLITEFLDQGSLYLFLRKNKLDSKMIMNIVKGIASGMLHLHSEGLIHRDLAARNILLGSGQQVKISDFGMSRHNSEDKNHTKSEIGPLKWMAPESIRDRIYSTATDVWSYGVTVWEIVTKEDPFSHLDSVQAALAVVHDNLRLKIPDNTPFVLAKVINLCFNIDPAQRPSFESILSTLQNATIEEWSFT